MADGRKFSKAYDHEANRSYLSREQRREEQFNGVRGCNPTYPAPVDDLSRMSRSQRKYSKHSRSGR